MPVVAHFEDIAQVGERRRSVRRALLLGAGAAGEFVTIRDISLTGMLLESSVAMLVGASFEVELPHAGPVVAVVVWTSSEFYGCEFERPISPAAVSAARLQSPPADDMPARPPDPVEEVRALNAEMERIAERLDRAIERLGKDQA
jgi:hypothetical protein